MMPARRMAVVGAGPAGLTAAHHLQRHGDEVVVFERLPSAGGRTHTQHFGPGWLGTFYPDTLTLLDDVGLGAIVSPLRLRVGGELRLDGVTAPAPTSLRRVLTTRLLGLSDRVRLVRYVAGLLVGRPDDLRIDARFDAVPALDELAAVGPAGRDRVVRPNFEGPFFARLEQMSAALVRSWMRCLTVKTFLHVDGGLDRPWRHLADGLDVRLGVEVLSVATVPTGDGHDGAAVDVRLYAARPRPPGANGRIGLHVFPNDVVATVEQGTGAHGAWGEVPADWEWALVCAPAAGSADLLDRPDDEVIATLWSAATEIHPPLFALADAVVELVRWEHAVPDVGVGYYARLGRMHQAPPLVFAGDWLHQPCVEGAVRSGLAAAQLLGAPVAPTETVYAGRRRWAGLRRPRRRPGRRREIDTGRRR